MEENGENYMRSFHNLYFLPNIIIDYTMAIVMSETYRTSGKMRNVHKVPSRKIY